MFFAQNSDVEQENGDNVLQLLYLAYSIIYVQQVFSVSFLAIGHLH